MTALIGFGNGVLRDSVGPFLCQAFLEETFVKPEIHLGNDRLIGWAGHCGFGGGGTKQETTRRKKKHKTMNMVFLG